MSSASSRAADPALQTAVLPPDRACAGGACAARGSSRSTLTRSGSPSLHSLVAYRTKRRLVAKPKPPSGARAQRELSDRAQRAFVSLFRSRALTLLLSFSRDSQRTKRGKVCARNVASRVIASDSTTAGGRCARASGLGSLLGGVLKPAARTRPTEERQHGEPRERERRWDAAEGGRGRRDARDEVVAVLGLLEAGERHLGARDVLPASGTRSESCAGSREREQDELGVLDCVCGSRGEEGEEEGGRVRRRQLEVLMPEMT